MLKVEVPVNMNYVNGYSTGEFIHSKEEAAAFFKEQSEATPLPFILSGVFQQNYFNKH